MMQLPKERAASLALIILFLGFAHAVLNPSSSSSDSGSSTEDGYHYCHLGKGLPVLYSCDQAFQGASSGSSVNLHGLPTRQEYIILLKNTTANGTADQICDNVRRLLPLLMVVCNRLRAYWMLPDCVRLRAYLSSFLTTLAQFTPCTFRSHG